MDHANIAEDARRFDHMVKLLRSIKKDIEFGKINLPGCRITICEEIKRVLGPVWGKEE